MTALALATGVAMATTALAASADPGWMRYKGKVIANGGLTIRSAPTTHARNEGLVAKGTTVTIACKVHATSVGGNRLWYRLDNGKGWLAARYVTNIGKVPRYCPVDDTTGGGTGSTTAAVNRRQGPHLKDTRLGTLPKGTRILVICSVKSPAAVDGNNEWFLLSDRKSWVTAAYLKRDVTQPAQWGPCTY
ncbi:SH3 domain-containing protein [Microlunatus sp. GCM10028923]|uniref:SH3 domain-containing protein n=1 Tax=Microlunatus sp. GCM10028923 TaxID=3273400 RepID=UPI00362408DA